MDRAKLFLILMLVAVPAAATFVTMLFITTPRSWKRPKVLGVYAYMYEFPRRDEPKNWNKFLDKVKAAGMYIVLPFVIDAYGYAYFNSSIVPINIFYFKKYGGDPLKDLIRKAHENNIKVYAWVVIGRVSRDVLVKHPSWAVYSVRGKSCLEEATPSGFLYLNLAVEGARDYVRSYVKELAERYDLDGFVWEDDLGWPPYADWGYGPYTRSLFAAWLKVPEQELKWPDDVREGGRYYSQFLTWREEVVTSLVCELYRTVKSARNVPVGAAVSPGLEWQRRLMGVNWVEWAKRGCVDFLSPMVYHRDEGQSTSWIYWQLKSVETWLQGVKVAIVPSVGGALRYTGNMPPEEWAEAVSQAVSAGADTVFVFADVCLDQAGAWFTLGKLMRD